MKVIGKRLLAALLALLCVCMVACVAADTENGKVDTTENSVDNTEELLDTDEVGGTDTEPTAEKKKPVTYELVDVVDKLKLHGRMYEVDTGITCDFTASGIEFKVYAEGDVKLKVTPTKDTYFTVWVDGERAEERFYAPAKATALNIASFKTAGEHTIRVLKQTEAQWSLCVLNSLSFVGEFKEAPAYSDKYIEIIGDSITTGHGNLGLRGDDGAGTALLQDGTTAFPFMTADKLGADASIVGCSGVGLDKGFTAFSEDVFYPQTSYYRSRNREYDFERVPDLVIINLGTNDQTKGSTKEAVQQNARELIEFIRSKYGKVNIIWTHNMMRDDNVEPWIKEVIDSLGGEAEGLYMCELNKNLEGGNGHPVEDAHIHATRLLRNFINDKGLLS